MTDIGLLYTVEEERSSTGAKAVNLHPLAAKCEYMINGEPTDNDLAIGSKGSFRLKIKTKGKAAHSAYPEMGDSAILTLLDILDDIRQTKFPNDDFFGDTTVNIGVIEGGVALNVIPPSAEASFLIRLTTKREPIETALQNIVRDRGATLTIRFVPGKQNQRVLCAPSDQSGTFSSKGMMPGCGVSVARLTNAPVSASVCGKSATEAGPDSGIRNAVGEHKGRWRMPGSRPRRQNSAGDGQREQGHHRDQTASG